MKKTLKDLPTMQFVKREISFTENMYGGSTIKCINDYFLHTGLNREFIRRTWRRIAHGSTYKFRTNQGIGWMPVNPNPEWQHLFGGKLRNSFRLCKN